MLIPDVLIHWNSSLQMVQCYGENSSATRPQTLPNSTNRDRVGEIVLVQNVLMQNYEREGGVSGCVCVCVRERDREQYVSCLMILSTFCHLDEIRMIASDNDANSTVHFKDAFLTNLEC